MMVVLRRLWVQLTADRRRFGLLCAALGVGLLLWARLIVISNAPRTAVADPDERIRVPDEPITGPPVDEAARASVPIVLETTPDRDPFVISERFFPKPTLLPDLTSERDKSDPHSAEDGEQVETRLASLVEQFSLDAVFSSAGMAVINGERYRRGESIPAVEGSKVSFTLAEVRYRAVTLVHGEYRFNLEMGRPGD